MPNWTFNKITFKGRPQTLQRLASLLKSDESVFDFNKVIPCPAELLKDDWQNNAEKSAENVRNYGYSGWYDWNIAKWGTKWNACHPRMSNGAMKGTLIYDFDTAWSPPTELIDEIARRYPSLTITHEAHEEAGMFPSFIRTYSEGCDPMEEEIPNINLIDEND